MDEETVTLRQLFECELRGIYLLLAERDRRYTEVAAERAKALSIKEQADRDALELARRQQTYKDEQGNRLREQLNAERGGYATHLDLKSAIEKLEISVAPLVNYVATQQGRSGGVLAGREWIGFLVGVVGALIGLGTGLAAWFSK